MLKSNGPRMLPCGTPELTGSLLDRVVFVRTYWYRDEPFYGRSGRSNVLYLGKKYLMVNTVESRLCLGQEGQLQLVSFCQWHLGFRLSLLPSSAILPYRSFAFVMTNHSSKPGRLSDP